MNLSQIKMVVSDMDGTLLNSNHEVSDRFFELFDQLQKKGILFVAASGRQYNSIVDKLDTIKNDIVVVAENGGYVRRNEEELLATLLPKDKQKIILDILDTVDNIHPVLCGKQNSYLTGNSDSFADLLKQYYSAYEIVEDLSMVDAEILKIAIYHFESSEQHIYPAVQHLEGDLKVKVSGPNWVDISSPDANKGFALQKLQELYNIKPSETMVFGDYNNDLEMLALAEYSFAMANAHPNVKKVAHYETESNDHFGVERILEKLIKA
ncbi:HAD family phosphatase [Maribacter polysiphoniae]|uniref:HAD family phosphatase n=2 Tax=Maribacter polysiphoniae TaxID=429344 RepID=A0ABR7VSG3_9FLAO|nr:HAD family hydrolase [Maribacter polysiphoniae]MBD1258958.1 HAD family phosphatase [Maribacter polysiphoniae]